jgi:hypothetical protein
MSTLLTLPGADAVARLLRDLFGKAVTPKKGAAMPSSTKMCVGAYMDDAGKLVAVGICDLPLGATMGAALALLAPGVAAEAARAGKLPEEMRDNLLEVLNVMATLFGGAHVRCRELLLPPAALPADVAAVVAKPGQRLDLDVTVAGYVGGKLCLATA